MRRTRWEQRDQPPTLLGRPLFSPDGRQLLTQPLLGFHTTSLWDLTGPAPVEKRLPESVRACRLLGWREGALVMIKLSSGIDQLLTWKGDGEPELLADLAEAGRPSPGIIATAKLSLEGNWLTFVRDQIQASKQPVWIDFSASAATVSILLFLLNGGFRTGWRALIVSLAVFAGIGIVIAVMGLDRGGLPLVGGMAGTVRRSPTCWRHIA